MPGGHGDASGSGKAGKGKGKGGKRGKRKGDRYRHKERELQREPLASPYTDADFNLGNAVIFDQFNGLGAENSSKMESVV